MTGGPETAQIAPVALMDASRSMVLMTWESSFTSTITPSLIVSFGVGATAALASSQPREVGSISTALMELEPMSIPTLDCLLKREFSIVVCIYDLLPEVSIYPAQNDTDVGDVTGRLL